MSKITLNLPRLALEKPDSTVSAKNIQPIEKILLAYGAYEAVASLAIGASVNFAYAYIMLGWAQNGGELLAAAWIASATIVVWSVARGHYQQIATRSTAAVTWSGLTACLRAFAVLITVIFVAKLSDDVSRGALICQFLAVTALTMLSRTVFCLRLRRWIAEGRVITGRMLIVGDSARVVSMITEHKFCDKLRADGKKIVRILAWNFVDDRESEKHLIDDVLGACRENSIDTVVVVPTARQSDLTERVTAALSETPATVHLLPFTVLGGPAPGSAQIGGQASIAVANAPLNALGKVMKRVVDVAIASAMLLALLPLMLSVAAAIKLDSRGPVFFRQNRHGYGNRHIRVFKFRSMRVMEDGAAFRQATRNDARITRVGRFIRRTNLDELPQLLNVLIGDMSLVGPRPHPIALNDTFAARIRLFHRRHNIMPGITGWAQVNGFRGETDTDDKMRKRVEHDLWYIDNWSIGLDLRILILTLFSSVAYRNAG
ncbi:hypothetical protein CHKEEEPN_1541 [Methylorubrum podarium]|nr:hypothetical protein CHKEEEPN_1541 [Methylorubrum podarium]